MAYRDFRDFMAVAEQRGKLRRIHQTVDRTWEPACLAKWVFQALPDDQRFGLWFETVAGSNFPLITGALGASIDTYALALGVEPEEINDVWIQALLDPKVPRIVESAPCQEVVRLGDEARLGDLPIPIWTPGKDAGPYITTITVNRRADTGEQNLAVYRTMVRDDHRVVVNLNPGRQGYRYSRTYLDQGKPAPIAWVFATEPAIHLATVANMPLGVDEITVAGGLKGEPIELVRAKTVDLLVPANAEIIIEGEVLPDQVDDEGPFGEFAGYMGPVAKKPVARITAITHRRNAIYYGYTSQMPPSESTVIQSMTNAPVLLKTLRYDHGETSVRDVFIDLTFGGLLAHCIVAMQPQASGHAKRIGRLIAAMTPLKRITVVDEDIDIRDPLHVEWAMNAHFNPVRDTVIIDDVDVPMYMDPSVRVMGKATEMGSQLVIDATQTIDAGAISLPSRELMMRALEVWQKEGLPDFEIPKRVHFRLDRS
jgi:4-hydroxy-3-polyprenylbenzoate decarboxylase